MDKSPSESLRLRGKKLVEEADAVGDSVELLKAHTLYLEQESVDSCPIRGRDRAYLEKIKLLREAVRFFKKAAAPEAKPKPGEAASAHKNMAIVLGELAVLNNNEGDISQSADIIYHWNKAMVYGLKDGFPENWHSGVRENLLKSAKKLVQLCRSAGVPAGIRRLENTLREVTDRELRYMILSVICELYIAGSLDDLNKRHYEIALDYMEECLIHFKEVETLVSNEEEKRFMVNMKRRIMDIKAEATAMQIIAKGNAIFIINIIPSDIHNLNCFNRTTCIHWTFLRIMYTVYCFRYLVQSSHVSFIFGIWTLKVHTRYVIYLCVSFHAPLY